MNKLNKTFYSGSILTAAELNLLTSKIDEIINNLPTSTTPTDPTNEITEQDITDKVNIAKAELQALIDQLDADLSDLLTKVDNMDNGNTETNTDTESLKTVKDDLGVAFRYMGITKNDDGTYSYNTQFGSSAIVTGIGQALAAIQTHVDTNGNTIAGIRANYYQDGTDSEGNPIYKPVYDGASIIASINSNGDSSVGISANKITLDGNTTLTGKLTALDADIARINVPDTATIKNAVISDIEAGNVTITGTLHYNRIIGNVTSVSSTTQLQDAAYFVQFTGPSTADVSQYPTLTLPAAPEVGQTLFINVGSKCCKLAANKPIDYFYMYDELSNGEYSIWSGRINIGETLNVADAGWNGVVQFIYTGTLWQQLIHNIRI